MRILLSIIVVFAITGCTNTNNTMTDRDKVLEELNPARNRESTLDTEWDSRLGYVNYSKDQVKRDHERNHTARIDRNQMADMIARIILRSNGFERVAALVTDKEVLIAYETNGNLTEHQAADIAKQTATSVMPSFFDIYVSDNSVLIKDIQSLHNSSTKNKNYRNTLEGIITEMRKYSQGFGNSVNE